MKYLKMLSVAKLSIAQGEGFQFSLWYENVTNYNKSKNYELRYCNYIN